MYEGGVRGWAGKLVGAEVVAPQPLYAYAHIWVAPKPIVEVGLHEFVDHAARGLRHPCREAQRWRAVLAVRGDRRVDLNAHMQHAHAMHTCTCTCLT